MQRHIIFLWMAVLGPGMMDVFLVYTKVIIVYKIIALVCRLNKLKVEGVWGRSAGQSRVR